jgi:hypothetical protein
METGHFYFAGNRTFLNCVDNRNLAPFRKVGDTAQARFASTPRKPPMALQRNGQGGMPKHELLQQSPFGF